MARRGGGWVRWLPAWKRAVVGPGPIAPQKIAAPRNLRETFLLFEHYRAEVGLDSITGLVDWTGVTPRQIYWAVLGRLPESREVALPGPDFCPAASFVAALNSVEFQEKFIENFVDAFAEKKRLLFVHIPKCAGTDLAFDLAARFPSMTQDLMFPFRTPKSELFERMAALAGQVFAAEALFVFGHIPLNWYIHHRVYRFGDRIFTTVREPMSVIISMVNYIVTVLLSDPEVERQDSAEWLAALGEARLDLDMSSEDLVQLARRILYNPALIKPNYLCSHLGTGTAESCFDSLAVADVEIVDISHYEEWRRDTWGLPESARINQSSPILNASNLTPEDRAYIFALSQEDQFFYKTVDMKRHVERAGEEIRVLPVRPDTGRETAANA